MSATQRVLRSVQGQVKPILSLNHEDARRRTINLYRAWYRQTPYLIHDWNLPLTVPQIHDKLREKFRQNKNVTDLRVIDMLLIRGHLELQEIIDGISQGFHIYKYFKEDYVQPKPRDFMSKFLSGKTD
ncbi:NADH dehydrogenase [ubiquinone] 1 alpha subcomplex subunit 6-like [Panonychus citri]|uniref:NADH dehydrogenase [ubiquinone] 1 alpha subcomplex subunit 6-like n=1 Tax=Panonychus citri TaxID=50023 RepID=UPI00230734C7|nr:NADH dehydrogenase [ubiquinone] 1 alpha subcomplex subunit 6-like [Panonychus citri]